jgi:hypothetical protein
MRIPSYLAGGSAVALLLTTTSAFADLTAQDVWADWQGYMQSMGYKMDGTQAVSGDTLTVSDIVMDIVLGDDEGTASLSLGSMSFTDNGDGTVSIGMAEEMPMVMNMTPKSGQPMSMKMIYTMVGMDMVASGTSNDLTYTYTADQVGFNLAEFDLPDEDLPSDFMSMTMVADDVSGVTTMKVGNIRDYQQTMNAGSATYDMTFVVPESEGGGGGTFKGDMDQLTFSGGGQLPLVMNTTDMAEMLAAGFNFAGGFEYAAGNSVMDFDTPDGDVAGTTSSDGGLLSVAMGGNGLSYDVTQNNLSVEMKADSFPFPIAIDMAKSAFNLAMPVSVSDEEQDFAFGFTMGDFTMSDILWSLFDPTAVLPRDAATLSLDLTGKAKMLVDIFDPEVANSSDAPGELNAINVNTLEVTAAGASLTGGGAFTFDNTDLVSFDGMPKPTGAMDLQLVGGNGLLNKLVEAGLLPQDQAMGARMMMGLFGVPGEAPDTLKSKIEVNEEGHVLANGQRLK